ncbi:MAG TPA: 16S rRNA (cytosine(1402)-N(4))-methyltransferase RsmH [Longimicrobiales bacterium]
MAEAGSYHEPVMVAEVLSYLRPERGGLYFDGTVGAGGHTEAILRSGAAARVIGVDQDAEALEVAGRRLEPYGDRVELVNANFADAAETDGRTLAGALLDLGVSSHQLDAAERGFSFRAGTPLDMRMSSNAAAPTAADVLNDWPESELADVFYRYGEERRSRRLAAAVVRRRSERPFRTSDDLNEVLDRFYGPRITVQDRARIYQALRIAVNDELAVLERALVALRDRLEAAGVFVVLSYHSLEDRIVKDAFREWSRDCVCPPELPVCRCRGVALGGALTRKPVMAGEAEVGSNPRARSARLRAWKKAV